MTIQYTDNFAIPVPDFLTSPWHQELQDALYKIDQLIADTVVGAGLNVWANSTSFAIGAIVIDSVTGAAWVVNVAHTTAATPTTFAAYRAANPTFYSQVPYMPRFRGAWANATVYAYFDIVYETASGIFAIALDSHTSSAAPATITDDAAHWTFLVHFNTHNADEIVYNNGASGLAAIEVQAAIDELADEKANRINPALTGTAITAQTPDGTNDQSIVNIEYLGDELAALIGAAPATLDTFAEIASAIGNDPAFATNNTAALALKAPLASPALTGTPTVPTPAPEDSSTKIASTEFVAAAVAAGSAVVAPPGAILPFGGIVIPDGYLFCDGSAQLRASYAALFGAIVRTSTVTFASGTDLINWVDHGLRNRMPVKFSTTGALAAPLVAGTTYYIVESISSAFKVSATAGGAAIDLTTDGSGVNTAICAPWGDGDGSTTFNLPNLQGAFPRGWDYDRGVDANRVFGADQADQIENHTHLYDKATITAGAVLAAGGDHDLLQTATASANPASGGGGETRPFNTAVQYIIKV